MAQTQDYRRELFLIFFAQSKIILWITAVIFIGSVFIAFVWPPIYATSGSILMRGKKAEQNPETLEDVQVRSLPLSKKDLASEMEILQSPDLIEITLQSLQQNNQWPKKQGEGFSFIPATLFALLSVEDAPKSTLVKEIREIRNNIKTEIVPESNVIRITLYNNDLHLAETLLNALLDQYVPYRMGVYSLSGAEKFFSKQAEQYKERQRQPEEALKVLASESSVTLPEKEMENNIILKNELKQQLNLLISEYIEKDLYVKHLKKAIDDNNVQFFSFIENIQINEYSTKLMDLIAERVLVRRTYHPSSEKVQSINQQIRDLFSTVKSEVMKYGENQVNQLNILEQKIDHIKDAIDELDKANITLQNQFVESQRIMREAELLQFSYETFARRREEAKINSAIEAANLSSYVTILSKAISTGEPVFPKKHVVIPLGLLVGFITGCSLGFVRDYFDHTFKTPSHVSNYAGLPLILSIPKWDNIESKKV